MGYIHNVQGTDHTVTDKDGQHFVIDAITRQITNNTGKVVLTKLDHNSECFTFEIPGEIEGHDMSDCNVVEVHYININSATREKNADVYTVNDFAVSEGKGTFTWLVSRSATQHVGTLSFAVRFACYPETEEGLDTSSTPLYSWRTGVFSGINIIDSVFSAEQAIGDYSDILESWWKKIESTHKDVYVITEEGAFINLTESMGNLETDVAGLKTAGTTMAGKLETLETDVAGLKTVTTTPATPTKDGMMSAEDKIKVDWLISNSYNDAIKIANNANADAFIEVDQDGESLTLQAYNQINLKSLDDHINFITNEEEGYSVKINGEKIATQEYVNQSLPITLLAPVVRPILYDNGESDSTEYGLQLDFDNPNPFEVTYHIWFKNETYAMENPSSMYAYYWATGTLQANSSGATAIFSHYQFSMFDLYNAKVYFTHQSGFQSPVVTLTETEVR